MSFHGYEDLDESESLNLMNSFREAPVKTTGWLFFWNFSLDSFRNRIFTLCLIILFMSFTVIITVLLFSLSNVFPVVIYKTELDNRDKADLKLFFEGSPNYFNYSNMKTALADTPEFVAAPRLYKLCYLEKKTDSVQPRHFNGSDQRHSQVVVGELKKISDPFTLLLLDFDAEDKMRFGDGLPRLSHGDVAVNKYIADTRNIKVNDTITVIIKETMLEKSLRKHWVEQTSEVEAEEEPLLAVYKVTVRVVHIMQKSNFRVRFSYMGGIIADLNTFQQHMIPFRARTFPRDAGFNDFLMQVNLTHYSSFMKLRLGDLKDLYFYSDLSNMRREFHKRLQLLNSKLKELFHPNGQLIREATMIERMQDREQYLSLMSTVFATVMGLCLLLAAYVISNVYSLVIYERQRDIAILRSLGTTVSQLYAVYLFQSLVIAVVSLFVSFLPLEFLFKLANDKFFEEVTEDTTIGFSLPGFVVGFLFAIIIPFFSTVGPLRDITKRTIVEGMDMRRQNNAASQTEITSERKLSTISTDLLVCAAVAFVFGVCLYLLMPLTFLDGNLFFLSMFLIALFSMASIGVGFILMSVLSLLNKISGVVMVFEPQFIRRLVNINTKTHQFYSVPTIFIMFAGIFAVNIMAFMLYFFQSTAIESDYRSQGGHFAMIGNFRNLDLKDWSQRYRIQENHKIGLISTSLTSIDSFKPKSRHSASAFYSKHQLATLGGIRAVKDNVRAVTPNFATVTNFEDYAKLEQFAPSTSLSTFEYLYTRFGQGTILMSAHSRKALGIDCMGSNRTKINLILDSNEKGREYFKVSCVGSYYALPAVYMRDFLNNHASQEMIVDFPTMVSFFDAKEGFDWESLAVWKYILRNKKGIETDSQLKTNYLNFKFEIFGLTRGYHFTQKESEMLTSQIGSMFFVIRLIEICMYLLMLIRFTYGMTQIFNRQKKTMGVMQSLGATSFQIAKVYFYETYQIILTSGIVSFLALCLMLFLFGKQMQSFIDVVFRFYFPFAALVGPLIFGFLLALVSAGFPVYYMVKDNTIELLRTHE